MIREWLTSHGRLVYDPPRPNMRKNKTKWWAVLEVDNSIAEYYRYWVKRNYHYEMLQGAWDAHITVIGGTEPLNKKYWGCRGGEVFEFNYEPAPQSYNPKNRRSKEPPHWWIRVNCPILSEIRSKLGLRPEYPYHITIGKQKYQGYIQQFW